jgi:6-phosphogluconolactonase
MLRKALGLLLVLAGITSCMSCGKTTSHYVFITIPAGSQVATYREDPNSGELTQIAGSPFPAGDGAESMVIHPSGKFLYVANPGDAENDVSLFTIATDGTLTEVTPRTSVAPLGSQPQLLVMDPSGNFLYVMNSGSNNISVFSIDPTAGGLTPVTGSPFFTGLTPQYMALAPAGNLLYVTSPVGSGQSLGTIEGFSVTSGVLSPLGVTPSDGASPSGLAINPKGTFLYVANKSSNTISIFAISASGALSEVSGSPLADVDQGPVNMIIDPTGTYLYVANQGSSNVSTYSLDSTTGFPTAIADSPFASEGNPSFLALDPSGKYLLVGNQSPGIPGLESFGVASGSLNTIFIYKTGNTPSSIAVLQ